MSNLNNLAYAAHNNAYDKGWWPPRGELMANTVYEKEIPEKLALIHSEVSELLEAYRDGAKPREIWCVDKKNDDDVMLATMENAMAGMKPEGIPAELADIIIRCLDFAGAFSIDVESAVRLKMAYNATRPVRHGGKLA